MNQAAKLVLRKGRYDSATEAMKTLHWLPIKHRSDFKIACLVHKALYGLAPPYLTELIQVQSETRVTRATSGGGVRLQVPRTKRKTFWERSFAAAGPIIWNSLPVHIRTDSDYNSFKKLLKTFYFCKAYV